MTDARALLKQYAEIDSHHVFRLKPEVDPAQQWHEGTIHEVKENIIIFSWAPSPFQESDDFWMQEHEIPIRDIEISTLKW